MMTRLGQNKAVETTQISDEIWKLRLIFLCFDATPLRWRHKCLSCSPVINRIIYTYVPASFVSFYQNYALISLPSETNFVALCGVSTGRGLWKTATMTMLISIAMSATKAKPIKNGAGLVEPNIVAKYACTE